MFATMPTKAPSRRQLASYLGHLVTEALERGEKGVALERRIGLSRAQLYNLRDGSRGAGMDSQQAFANAYFGGDVGKLNLAARAWAEQAQIPEGDEDSDDPKLAVRASPAFRDAPVDVQRAYDARDPFTRADARRTFTNYMRFLLRLIDDFEHGMLEQKPGEQRIEVKDPDDEDKTS